MISLALRSWRFYFECLFACLFENNCEQKFKSDRNQPAENEILTANSCVKYNQHFPWSNTDGS